MTDDSIKKGYLDKVEYGINPLEFNDLFIDGYFNDLWQRQDKIQDYVEDVRAFTLKKIITEQLVAFLKFLPSLMKQWDKNYGISSVPTENGGETELLYGSYIKAEDILMPPAQFQSANGIIQEIVNGIIQERVTTFIRNNIPLKMSSVDNSFEVKNIDRLVRIARKNIPWEYSTLSDYEVKRIVYNGQQQYMESFIELKKDKWRSEQLKNIVYHIYEFYFRNFPDYPYKSNVYYKRKIELLYRYYWQQKLGNKICAFDGNVMLQDSLGTWVSSEKKKIMSVLKEEGFHDLYKLAEKSNGGYALRYLISDLALIPNQVVPCPVPFVQLTKRMLFAEVANKYIKECITQKYGVDKNYRRDRDKKLYKMMEQTGFALNPRYDTLLRNYVRINYGYDFTKKKFNISCGNDFKKFSTLFQYLHTITDGDLNILDELSKVFARIYLGKQLLRNEDIIKLIPRLKNSKPAIILSCSNPTFVSFFIRSMLLFPLVFPPERMHDEKLNYPLPIWYDNVPVCGEIGLKLIDFFIRIPKYDSNKFKKDTDQITSYKKPYHITEYSIKELCEKENIGKMIEDKFYGNIINIDTKDDELDLSIDQVKYLYNLMSGEECTQTHEFLGKQKFMSNSTYIFIRREADELRKAFVRDKGKEKIEKFYVHIPLSDKIPNVAGYYYQRKPNRDFRSKILSPYFGKIEPNFSNEEKLFMAINFSLYGLKLLMEQREPEAETVEEFDVELTEKNVLPLFIKECCVKKEVSFESDAKIIEKEKVPELKKKIQVDQVVALTTLQAGYKLFCESIFGKGCEKRTWNKNIVKNKFFDNCIAIVGHSALSQIFKELGDAERKKGFDENEITQTNGVLIAGLAIKQKEEIELVAFQLRQKMEEKKNRITMEQKKNERKLEFNDFAKYLVNEIGNADVDEIEVI